MGVVEDKRFQLGWVSVVLMLGISILLGYFGLGIYAAGTFLFGLGLILIALSIALGQREMAITGTGLIFAILGAVILLISAGINPLLIIGGVLAGVALAAMIYLATKK